ncbi:MAG: ExeM/NucH family extracellular endonuclease, partial [Chloroflexi bacterium]|nr:ExeM/NucH family extracellular endonuclease [Chloroflexota bacterium]
MNKRSFMMFTVFTIFSLLASVISFAVPQSVLADGTYQSLPYTQDWSNTGLITVSDDWSGVSGVIGYRGDGLTSSNDVNPQLVLGQESPLVVDVNANQTAPNTFTTGGVAEFHITNPAVALTGSGTADAPYIVFHINATGFSSINVSYNLRDLDGSTDNAAQQVALQYRVGETGNFTNVPAGYVADATSGPSLATLVIPVNATLPAAADNQSQLQIRVITTNASGNDEWVGIDDVSITGSPIAIDSAPGVSSTYPLDEAVDFPVNANLTVTFSEPVTVTGTWFDLSCSVSGNGISTAVSGGPTVFTLDPNVNLIDGEDCTLIVYAAQVADQDANDPPDNMQIDFTIGFSPFDVCAAPYTPIYSIQGSGATVALTGTRTTQGVVVGDYEGASPALRGFFIQDPDGDDDPTTSDGIFVFEGSNANTVNLGDVVRVTGTAGENQGQSQISVGTIINCGTGSVTPTDVDFPVASADFLERYEGMLVRLTDTMYVTEHFQLGRFGQVVLSSDGRLQQPTNIVAPGAPALALQAQNNLNKIILDDALQVQNPDPILFGRNGNPLSASNTLRGGDTATNIIGVMTYTWAGNSASGNAYRVRPINALGGYVNFVEANPRPTAAPDVEGSLTVVGMNLLNFFNTFDGLPDNVDNCAFGVGGAPADCRGADTASEFARQVPKTVAAILAMDADVIGVNEIENDGYGPDSAIQHLVNQLNAATAPGTYAFIDVDANTGQVNAMGTDAIKVGLIYKPGSVTPVGQTAALNTVAFVNGGDSAPRSRPSLAQAFEQNSNSARFIVNVNHLKSKGSACDVADAGDGQGNCNLVRVNAVTELMAWLASDPTGTGDPDILLVGDYNSYAMEDPIAVIENSGFTHLIKSFLGEDAYSYVFDGQWGYLDHALGTSTIVPQISGVADYHINSDEPSVLDYNTDFKSAGQIISLYDDDEFRVSDHDPVLVGLELDPDLTCNGLEATIVGTTGDDEIYGTNGSDVIVGLGGNDVIHGGNGNDVICGGHGDDTLYGGNGNDTLVGSFGNDALDGGNGDDSLDGGDGNDSLNGQKGNDILAGGKGNDTLTGANGDDSLTGNA